MNPYIRLAEAIERGAKLRPQGWGAGLRDGKSCALYAAYEVLCDQWIPFSYGWFTKKLGIPHPIIASILGKNDHSGMTREEIAQWLRTLPEAQDTQPSTANPIAAPSPEGVGQGEAASQWAAEQVKKLLEGVAA